ncbi:hypothetical protein HWB57_gp037 [Erwinia phage vB_EamM-Bue1]|uniref:Uncharacterized protein n=1 Tax=Erwinia phage vB_EamM-Bue1 TaxID=2099338 RepID=A0A2U9PEL0_9CAUD|nr:hypothetical protein HWB57_gp037 [Erwinia phage vB_EamM-Bue1]AWT50344.1 hypothetical protein [Erwinia phage vB_EamM-Bue1]
MSYNLAGICLSITVMIAMLIAFRFVNDFSTVRNKADKHGLKGRWATPDMYYMFRDKVLQTKLGNYRGDEFSIMFDPQITKSVLRQVLANLDYPDIRLLRNRADNTITFIVLVEGYLYRMTFILNFMTSFHGEYCDDATLRRQLYRETVEFMEQYQGWTRTQRIVKMAEEELLHAKVAQ